MFPLLPPTTLTCLTCSNSLPLLLLLLHLLPASFHPSSSSHLLFAVASPACSSSQRFRTLDGTCTTSGPSSWGSAALSQHRYVPPSRIKTHPLPSARHISNALHANSASSARRKAWASISSSKTNGKQKLLTEFAVLFSQFVDHDLVNTPQDTTKSFPIPVPKDDKFFRRLSYIPFHNSTRLTSKSSSPLNMATPALDLSQIYGSSLAANAVLRSGRHGYLRHSYPGDYLAVDRNGFFMSGDARVNEHPLLICFHTLFSREHNRQAALIRKEFPIWSDTRVFNVARERNIALYQYIVYHEMLPAFLGGGENGRRMPVKYSQTNSRRLDPKVSVEFSTAAFRVGHGMANGVLSIGAKSVDLRHVFFQPAKVFRTRGGVKRHLLETFIRPVLPAGMHVAPALRNGLFDRANKQRGKGQVAFDLVANNIQRGRDHGLPSFNAMRAKLGLRKYKTFYGLCGNTVIARRMRKVYGKVERVELWPGVIVERKGRGEVMGETARRMWRREFERVAAGDRRWFARHQFVKAGLKKKKGESGLEYVSMREMLLRNSDISDRDMMLESLWVYAKAGAP